MRQEHNMCFWKDFNQHRKVESLSNESHSMGITCRNRNGGELGFCSCNTCLCFLSVTTCGRATKAPEVPREDKDKFDLVINDVYMPAMDGFRLLELVGVEMDLPIISKFVSWTLPQCLSNFSLHDGSFQYCSGCNTPTVPSKTRVWILMASSIPLNMYNQHVAIL
jgi:CheY-like chemotaxis protein